MENLEKSFIEWCEKIKKLRNEEITLDDITEEERDLFKKERLDYTFNWDGIYCAVFDKKDKYATIPKCPIPECMKEMFEIDEQGNPTGNYNWDYAIKIIEDVAGCNIHDIWNPGQEDKADEINNILLAMPNHMGNVLSNMDNASELYDALVAAQEADLNCPKEIRENKELIYELFEMSDYSDIPSCFDLMSDELKNDKEFLARLFELEQVQNGDDIFDKINPELYKDDDEFKKKMIECWGLDLFVEDWKESSHLWDESMKKMSDEKFFKSREYLDLEIMETTKPELAQKIYDEIDRRSKDKDEIEDEQEDVEFEINEFGEIIRPAKQSTAEELENMSEEELQEMIESNDKTIEQNNKALKKSLVDRVLEQQKIISEQQQEITRLNSQKKEL